MTSILLHLIKFSTSDKWFWHKEKSQPASYGQNWPKLEKMAKNGISVITLKCLTIWMRRLWQNLSLSCNKGILITKYSETNRFYGLINEFLGETLRNQQLPKIPIFIGSFN